MTITATNIKAERLRVKNDLFVMSCYSSGVSFTKAASQLLGGECKISFEKGNGKFIAYRDDINGFQVRYHNGITIIGSRPLRELLEDLFERSKPKFEISECNDFFELKLIK